MSLLSYNPHRWYSSRNSRHMCMRVSTAACKPISTSQHRFAAHGTSCLAGALTISSSVRALVSLALRSVLTATAVKRHLNMCPRRQGTLVRPRECGGDCFARSMYSRTISSYMVDTWGVVSVDIWLDCLLLVFWTQFSSLRRPSLHVRGRREASTTNRPRTFRTYEVIFHLRSRVKKGSSSIRRSAWCYGPALTPPLLTRGQRRANARQRRECRTNGKHPTNGPDKDETSFKNERTSRELPLHGCRPNFDYNKRWGKYPRTSGLVSKHQRASASYGYEPGTS